MKQKFLLFALFAIVALFVSAQADYSNYLNKAMEKLDEGDCSSAQKFYNVYKELSGKTVSSVEMLISDCGIVGKKFTVGEIIRVNDNIYRVAHIEDGGLHGFAVCEMGSGPFKKEFISDRLIPTWTEFEMIAENNSILKLRGQYWTPRYTAVSGQAGYTAYGLGGESNRSGTMGWNFDILYIYRF